jgi:hypothetical protein
VAAQLAASQEGLSSVSNGIRGATQFYDKRLQFRPNSGKIEVRPTIVPKLTEFFVVVITFFA